MLVRLTLIHYRWSKKVLDLADAQLRWADDLTPSPLSQLYIFFIFIFIIAYFLLSLPFLLYFECRKDYFLNHPEILLNFPAWMPPYRGRWIEDRKETIEKVNWKRDGF